MNASDSTEQSSAKRQDDGEAIRLIQEGYQMLYYVARHGELTLDVTLAAGIQRARSKLGTRAWNMDDEIMLMQCYDKLAQQIYPVTLESIQAVETKGEKGEKARSAASKVITWYRRYTVFTLVCLLCVQMYYLFGYDLTQSLIDTTQADIAVQYTALSAEKQAKYQLLQQWNRVWLFGQEPELMQQGRQANVSYSANIIAAQSVLHMLQNYILPLLYGLLGAFIFVLRSLLLQVRSLTYTSSREIGYRLRLTIGCLAGMLMGWVLKPDVGDMAFSPLALAFLAGYSIEVMFTLLDRLIEQIRQRSMAAMPNQASSSLHGGQGTLGAPGMTPAVHYHPAAHPPQSMPPGMYPTSTPAASQPRS